VVLVILGLRMRYPVWIRCCKRPNYDVCISQGSVVTVLNWGGQNYSHLRQFFLAMLLAKIIKIGLCFTAILKNKRGLGFARDGIDTGVNLRGLWTFSGHSYWQ